MKIILGITGSIAAYKTPELIRTYQKAGIDVIPVLTEKGSLFVTATSLGTVAQHPVYTDTDYFKAGQITHLQLLKDCHALVIAPASANTIATLAHGLANSLLTNLALAFTGPKIIVPAMHHEMWINPITQDNIHKLQAFGFHVVGPASGELACKDEGMGRMVDLDLIVLQTKLSRYAKLPKLIGKKILISCGGTREAMDSVRYIANRSSGRLASMLSNVASLMGAQVTVVSTVPLLENPHINAIHYVNSATEMQDTLHQHFPKTDALFMAAAVADYTMETTPTKLTRKEHLTLNLYGTPDILKSLAEKKDHQTMIGFCLAHHPFSEIAEQKLHNKDVDFMVANTPDQFGKDKRSVTIFSKQNSPIELHQLPLEELCYRLLELCI